MADFHFLRPEFLLALIPLFILVFLQVRSSRLSGQWSNIVAPQLREFVIKQADQKKKRAWSKPLIAMATLLAILAASGPSWEKQASQIYNSRSGIIVALDLSLSMTAQDVTPSRLQRAKYKITDILNQEVSRNIGLIAYAADTHIASPLTRDADTLKALLPALDPFIMPGNGGSNTLRLAEEAVNLFAQSKSEPRTLILVTDGVEPQDIDQAAALLKENKVQLSILAIGTEQGAPMMQPDGRFFKGADGLPIMPPLEFENLHNLSAKAGGKIQKFSNTDSDIEYLLSTTDNNEAFTAIEDMATFDQWKDSGYWLMLPVLLLALLAFRKGVILVAVIAICQPSESWALPEILLNDDQIAHKQFESNPEAAAQQFNDQSWKASSLYKAGKYEDALAIWQNKNDAQSWYNRGNSLAQLGKLDEALHAYNKALDQQPDLEDAAFNKSIVEQLKEQQDQQQNGQDGQQSDQQNSQNQQQDGNQQGQQNDQQQDQEQDGQQNDQQQNSSQQSDQNSQDQSEQNASSSDPMDEYENPMNQLSQEERDQKEAQEKAAQQQNESEQGNDGEERQRQLQQKQMTQKPEMTEKDQAVMQMMNKIPDDPAGLLRNKFYYQYQQRNRQQQNNGDRKSW